MSDWFKDMFIDEAKPALDRHSGAGEVVDTTAIYDALKSVGVSITEEDTSDSIASKINELDIYQTPWEIVDSGGTDALGDFVLTVGYNVAVNPYHLAGYYRLKAGCICSDNSLGMNASCLSYVGIDLSEFPSSGDFRKAFLLPPILKDEQKGSIFTNPVTRIILPETSSLPTYLLANPPYGVYLPRHEHGVWSSAWIRVANTATTTPIPIVKCPNGSDARYYLNRILNITVEDIVGIFENMIDRSGEDTEAYITIGTDNLAKLTDEQKEIAYAKGWSLQ